jgi:hypothetical protein
MLVQAEHMEAEQTITLVIMELAEVEELEETVALVPLNRVETVVLVERTFLVR